MTLREYVKTIVIPTPNDLKREYHFSLPGPPILKVLGVDVRSPVMFCLVSPDLPDSFGDFHVCTDSTYLPPNLPFDHTLDYCGTFILQAHPFHVFWLNPHSEPAESAKTRWREPMSVQEAARNYADNLRKLNAEFEQASSARQRDPNKS